MRKLILSLLVLLALSLSAQAQDTIKQKIDSVANVYLSRPNNVGLMVGMFRQRTSPSIEPVPEFYGYGHIRKDTSSPAPDSLTVFKLGSVGKTFAATILAFLVEYNIPTVTLYDRINKYLPDTLNIPVWVDSLSGDTTFITLRDLAMHISGFPDEPSNHVNPPGYTVQKMYEFLNGYTLPYEPGSHWVYSNYGFGLLGVIETIIMHQPYDSISLRVIADSLEMPDTRVFPTPEMKLRLALGYNHKNGNVDTAATSPAFYGAGGHYSCMKDMMRYLRYQIGFGNKPSMNKLLDTLHLERRYAYNNTSWQGLAWQMNYLYKNKSSEKRIWKDGATAGYSTFICWLPLTRTGVVVLSNSTDAVDSYAIEMLKIINPLESLGGIGIQQISTEIPEKFNLYQNYPNPFNPTTQIKFDIPLRKSFISLKVYDSLGQEVADLVEGEFSPGTYSYAFDGGNLSSGVYYYSLQIDGEPAGTRKMVILK
ncbi:MAG: serine hydrolase [Ignavibacteriae bacterium]|nr:serine hydrolase [Ignavibacteriota bacterium]